MFAPRDGSHAILDAVIPRPSALTLAAPTLAALALAGLTLGCSVSQPAEPPLAEEAIWLETGWQYRYGDRSAQTAAEGAAPAVPASGWRPSDSLVASELVQSGEVWLRLRLPEVTWAGESRLFLAVRAPRFALYLDGALIHESREAIRGESWSIVPLPADLSGRLLQVWEPRPRLGALRPENWLLASRAALPKVLRLEASAALRRDAGPLLLGVLLSATGLVAIVLYLLRRRPGELFLIAFGAFALLYGIRLMVPTTTVALIFNPTPRAQSWLLAWLTYVMPVPGFLYFEQLLGPGWRSSTRRVWQVFVVFALVAVLSDALTGEPGSAFRISNLLVIGGILVAVANASRRDLPAIPGLGVLRAGFLIFATLAINDNLEGVNLVPWRLGLEPVGFFLLVCSLGWAGAQTIFSREKQLASIESELETARRIQTSILPSRMPEIAGLSVAARYLPMSSVAGDFYDFLEVDERRLGVLVADVSGHGVPAALIASMVKIAISAQAERAAEPASVLEGMNRIFLGKLQRQFVTAAYLFIDLDRATVSHASGGHPSPLLWRRATAKLEELTGGGPLLGRFAEARFESATAAIEPGDRIVLFTDGLVEAAGPSGEPFGEERLRAAIECHRGSPDALAEALLKALCRWTQTPPGASLDDDLTLLVVEIAESQEVGSAPGAFRRRSPGDIIGE